MAYSTGILDRRVSVLSRTAASPSRWGRDGSGIWWKAAGTFWASVDWARGKQAMNAGALDAYAVVIVRMRWTDAVTPRSRIRLCDGTEYQILPDTFHADRRANTVQFHAQAVTEQETLPPQ